MRLERACVALLLTAGLVVFPACAGENQDETLRTFTMVGTTELESTTRSATSGSPRWVVGGA